MIDQNESPGQTALLALAGLGCAVGLLLTLLRITPKEARIDDFVQEWTSARNHLQGRPVYEDLRVSVEREFSRQQAQALPNHYNAHPPVAVLLAVPFATLRYRTAHRAWNIVSLLALAGSLWLILGRNGLKFPAGGWLYVAAVLLLSTPMGRQMTAGQLNLLLLFLITACWAAMRAERNLTAGLLLGAAAAVKLFPAFLFLYPLAARRWRVIAAGGVAFLGLHAVAWGVLGTAAFEDYATVVVPSLRQFQDWWLNFSLLGYFRKLTYVTSGHNIPLIDSPALCYTLTGVSILAVTLASFLKTRSGLIASHNPTARFDHGFAICIIANLLVSPITWDHYFLLLTLPILILWPSSPAWWQRGLLLTFAFALAINVQWVWDPLIAGDHELAYLWGGEASVATPFETIVYLSYPFYALLGLFAYTVLLRPTDSSLRPTASSDRAENFE